MIDVRNMMVQRREHQRGMRFCLLAYPCQVWAHRWFTPCIVSVFPLSRVLERGTFHSTGMSRFVARPGPVPLQRSHLNRFCYVAGPYSGTACPRGSLHARVAPLLLFGSMLSETPGLVRHSPWRALTHGLRVGQYDQQTPKLSRSRGYVSDSEHPPFTSPNAHCHSSGSGRLDRPYPGRLLLCEERWHTFLLSSGSEPG